MVNQYIWDNYLKSGGKLTVEKFQKQLSNRYTSEYADLIKELHSVYSPETDILNEEHRQLVELVHTVQDEFLDIKSDEEYYPEGLLDDLHAVLLDIEGTSAKAFENFSYNIAYYSTRFSLFEPELYIPYYFRRNFNVLEIIAGSFDIRLPDIPKKSDYTSRFMYYAELCNELNDFRESNHWSPFELLAFLYDFAPKYIGGLSSYLVEDLPDPRSAFFIGGVKEDSILSSNPNEITLWQCNPDTRAGDMIVMYLRTPVSAVDSVWRSCSVGFIDPFFYYYRCTYISHPLKMKPVALDRLKTDKITRAMPIVRKNMQGINGVELKPSEYNRILQMGRSKAQKLEYVSVKAKGEYSTEKEVEEYIIKPLLKQLGYSEQDYVQQLYLEIGNHNHALIPDFVLFPEKHNGHQSAFAIIEAKRSITNQQELDAALSQVRSYAKLLGAKYAAIISQEKVWVYSAEDDYSSVLLCVPVNMTDDEMFSLRKILGAK